MGVLRKDQFIMWARETACKKVFIKAEGLPAGTNFRAELLPAPLGVAVRSGLASGVTSGVPALHLGPTAALFEVRGGLLLRGVADDDGVVDRDCSSRFCHACRIAFVLHDIGPAFNGGNAALHVDCEFVGGQLRFGKLGADDRFELSVWQSRFGD